MASVPGTEQNTPPAPDSMPIRDFIMQTLSHLTGGRPLLRYVPIGALLSLLAINTAAAHETAQVFVLNGELNYIGQISPEANRMAFKALSDHDNNIKWLSIRSTGGDVEAGLELGLRVYRSGLGVKVVEYCLSSCANYVFTAGKEKIVSNFAMIGFHGGASSTRFNMQAVQESQKGMSAEEIARFKQAFQELRGKYIRLEEDFYRQIGVRQDITTIGQSGEYEARYSGRPEVVGWYYTPGALGKLGVANITVINPPWIPRAPSPQISMFEIDF